MFNETGWHGTGINQSRRRGWIEVITGCMFSGKTEELIRRVNRAIIARQKVKIFKPAVDVRYHVENVVSHNENFLHSTPIVHSSEILQSADDCHVIAIDEAQFLDAEVVPVCNTLANRGIRVIVAGLDMDFTGRPFENIPQLMAIAEFVTKIHAICAICGADASFSYRFSPNKEKVLIGEKDVYESRCRECFTRDQK